ncbi:MAG: substrate-binding domain-containing protein [Alphaproteobacteria bacterium]
MKRILLATTAALVLAASASAASAQSREQIRVVGSSTVFPYSTVIAETFAGITGNPAPVVESTGTGGGMQIFCDGVGIDKVDATGASRAMTQGEYDLCQQNGVTDISELQLGYDGLSLAVSSNGQAFDIALADLHKALAADVEADGEVVANPYTNWSQIDPSYPDIEITVFGPPPTSGTRDAWVELVMEEGCAQWPAIAALEETDEDRFEQVCQRMREDGHFVEAGENDNLIVQRMISDPNTYGIFGYSYFYENRDQLSVLSIDGVAPDETTIADFSYPVSRPLFLYFKNAHRGVIPGLQEFIEEAASEEAIGPDSYLLEIGLVPAPKAERDAAREAVVNAVHFTRYE